jgi:hypothetical protein
MYDEKILEEILHFMFWNLIDQCELKVLNSIIITAIVNY